MSSSSSLLLLVFVILSFFCLSISSQSSGHGGGICYEEKVVYACPSYNYNTTGTGSKSYEHRLYDENTWAIESTNFSIIQSTNPQPIEGLIAAYPPLDAYFNGANSANLTITRMVAPVSVIVFPVIPGVYGYAGLFFLPPLSQNPIPPDPTTSSVRLVGGGNTKLQIYSQSFSLNTIPTDSDINDAALSFSQQLSNDGVNFTNITIVSFYDAIDAKGNWSASIPETETKGIWFTPGMGSPLTAHFDRIKKAYSLRREQ